MSLIFIFLFFRFSNVILLDALIFLVSQLQTLRHCVQRGVKLTHSLTIESRYLLIWWRGCNTTDITWHANTPLDTDISQGSVATQLRCGEIVSDIVVQIPLDSSRHGTTRHVRRVEPMHFGFVELVKQHGSTHSTRRARLVRHVRHDERDRRDSQLCCVICIKYVM